MENGQPVQLLQIQRSRPLILGLAEKVTDFELFRESNTVVTHFVLARKLKAPTGADLGEIQKWLPMIAVLSALIHVNCSSPQSLTVERKRFHTASGTLRAARSEVRNHDVENQ